MELVRPGLGPKVEKHLCKHVLGVCATPRGEYLQAGGCHVHADTSAAGEKD